LHPITLKDTHTHHRNTLDEGSAQLNTHNRLASMPPAGFEPTIPAGERPQAHALDRAATEIGQFKHDSENCKFGHFCRN